jgi:hypothetical protein
MKSFFNTHGSALYMSESARRVRFEPSDPRKIRFAALPRIADPWELSTLTIPANID